MTKQLFENTCKSVLTLEQYLDSCPNIEAPSLHGVPYTIANQLFALGLSGNKNVGVDYSLRTLKSSFENNGLIEYIKSPRKMIEDSQRLPQLKENSSVISNVPKVFQGLWLASKYKPQPIIHDLENFLTQAKKLVGYEIIIWTNINPNKLKEHNPKLEEENIKVYNLGSIDTEYKQLLNFILSPAEYVRNVNNFNAVIIDAAKNIIMESTGGILADFNFKFNDNFQQSSIQSYDFIADYKDFNLIENGFFIAKPHHIIFRELLNIQDEMIFNPECSLKELRDDNRGKEGTFSMTLLMMAYLKYNNQDGNIDALIQSRSCQNKLNVSKAQAHEEMVAQLESDNPEQFSEYAYSFMDNVNFMLCFSSFVTEPIGRDHQGDRSWSYTDLV